MNYPLIGLLGGTFDPVHNGHLAIATHCMKAHHLNALYFIPNQNKHHKDSVAASGPDRLAMLELATQHQTNWHIDEHELNQSTPAFTIDTLKYYRNQDSRRALCFILSVECFNLLHTWRQYQQLLNHCHLIVVGRHMHVIGENPWQRDLIRQCEVENAQSLSRYTHGKILIDAYQPPCSSSSEIQAWLKSGDHALQLQQALPAGVMQYIKHYDLYR